ncbi:MULTISPECIES: DUF6380 family protein [Streptomyces]|nr:MULTISPECIES: DUF6380 family protein [Streptomyces]
MDTLGHGDAAPGKRRATLRSATASLTATACRAPFHHHGRAAGEGAR